MLGTSIAKIMQTIITLETIFLTFLLLKFIFSPHSITLISYKIGDYIMKIPFIFISVVFAVIWVKYATKKSDNSMEKSKEEFWDKEHTANTTRKADISHLNYIQIPVDKLPMDDQHNPTIDKWRDTIQDLSNKKILNLTGISNTDLKLKYGIGNLNSLSEYDNNYTILVRSLQKWAENLYNNSLIDEATQVLEFAMASYTDIVKSYRLLSKIYVETNSRSKIENIINHLTENDINIHHKEELLEEFNQLITS